MFDDIIEIWEIDDEDDVNILLKHGWKILQIIERMKSVSEEGWIHSKFVGVGSEIIYVMSRAAGKNIPPHEDQYESVHSYHERCSETKA